ncbi:MAG: type I-B CRISPR-associated protein Cas5 [Firmicutes bacterium]|nr:type I-B CRISPR-associated protein Cas5 [Bacillota bacterium]
MAVAFNVSAPIAMFRRPYTTTSSVSFPIPPPTAIAGLLGAIIGLPNGSDEKAFYAKYWDEMKGTKIALSVINPISWFLTSINFWNLKEPQKSPHIRVKHQFVRQPKYRIYVHGGVEEKLRQHLENGTFIYTPFLGTAYAIAEIEYLGQFPLQAVEENEISLASVLPLLDNQTVKIDIFASKGIFRDTLPFSLSSERSLIKTINTIYTSSAKEKIHLTSWEGLDVTAYKDEYIAWFPAW